jgi:hypothetical protein
MSERLTSSMGAASPASMLQRHEGQTDSSPRPSESDPGGWRHQLAARSCELSGIGRRDLLSELGIETSFMPCRASAKTCRTTLQIRAVFKVEAMPIR